MAYLTNYSIISDLPWFSKRLGKLKYNEFCMHLAEHNVYFSEQFGFWTGHSIDNAIIETIDEITNGFMENKYTVGVFMDLSKTFVL